MADTKLLASVLSDKGWYCVVGLKDGAMPKQVFVETLEEASECVDQLVEKHYNAYFACAKYSKKGTRTKDNAGFFKAFWLDIDCGEGKPYETREEGIAALGAFCQKLDLPKPTVVNSGRGIHVYWILTSDIERKDWKPIAETLKAVCTTHDLYADPAVTADEARILRVPGTFNYKSDPPTPVEVIQQGDAVSVFDFSGKLGPIKALALDSKQPLNELTLALMGNQEHRFKTIMLKTVNGVGCAQLRNIVENQSSISEPLWRAGLSIAAYCADKDKAIHRMSEGHENYTPEDTEAKAAEIKGPYTCDKFDDLNPGLCDLCPNRGKVKSPIVLGREILAASEEDNLIEIAVSKEETPVVYQIPDYPSPYFRGKNGGVYVATDDEGDLVYEHDLYAVKRMKDPQKGEVVLLRLHRKMDGIKEFVVPYTDIMSKERCKEALAFHGVVGAPKQMEKIAFYIITFIKELNFKQELEIMRTQFGWADNDTKIIIGDREISIEGVRYSPPSHATSNMSALMEPCGSLDEWKSVVNTYNLPGHEPHAFGFFTAFGSPLLKHLNLKGAAINMINNDSGTGKTTVIKAMMSVYGHPEDMMLNGSDTVNVVLNRLGIFGNLPPGLDEATNMKPEAISDFLYMVSQGRGKNRMKSQVNEERVNLARWALICLCTSNSSFVDKLRSLKATPDGELMRLLEYDLPTAHVLSKAEADEIFPKLYDNYGLAGTIYSKWLVGNLEEAIDTVRKFQALIDNAVKLTNRERFWSGVAACNIGGAYIASKLGLHDIDVTRVLRWTVNMLKTMRQDIKPPATTRTSAVSEYINENINSLLIVNGEVDKRTNIEMLPILEPKNGNLLIRMEPDTKRLYIAAKQFRKFCTENQITLKELLNNLALEGIYLGTENRRMAKGTKIPSGVVNVYAFDCSVPDFIDTDAYVGASEIPNESARD